MTEINKIFKKLQETLEASSSKVINRTFSEKKCFKTHQEPLSGMRREAPLWSL